MPTYYYKCNNCEKLYSETRDASYDPHFTQCECGSEYSEIAE